MVENREIRKDVMIDEIGFMAWTIAGPSFYVLMLHLTKLSFLIINLLEDTSKLSIVLLKIP